MITAAVCQSPNHFRVRSCFMRPSYTGQWKACIFFRTARENRILNGLFMTNLEMCCGKVGSRMAGHEKVRGYMTFATLSPFIHYRNVLTQTWIPTLFCRYWQRILDIRKSQQQKSICGSLPKRFLRYWIGLRFCLTQPFRR